MNDLTSERVHDHHGGAGPADDLVLQDPHGRWTGIRDTLGAVVGAALGLLPHLLHHVSLFAVGLATWVTYRGVEVTKRLQYALVGFQMVVLALFILITALINRQPLYVLFAGALVITGAAGNLLFGALGLLLSVPLLRRLYRRFGTWKAPTLALVAFAAMFSLSAFVIGPALTGAESDATPAPPASETPDPGAPSSDVDHDGHHGG